MYFYEVVSKYDRGSNDFVSSDNKDEEVVAFACFDIVLVIVTTFPVCSELVLSWGKRGCCLIGKLEIILVEAQQNLRIFAKLGIN